MARRVDSNEMTGLSSRIADFSRPFRSYGVDAKIIFRPARFMNMEYGLCECWAAIRPPPPTEPRNVMGNVAWPPNM